MNVTRCLVIPKTVMATVGGNRSAARTTSAYRPGGLLDMLGDVLTEMATPAPKAPQRPAKPAAVPAAKPPRLSEAELADRKRLVAAEMARRARLEEVLGPNLARYAAGIVLRKSNIVAPGN